VDVQEVDERHRRGDLQLDVEADPDLHVAGP
jgi:hypothetical protein